MWTVWSPNGTGVGAQLRAYDPVPVDGVLKQVSAHRRGTPQEIQPARCGGEQDLCRDPGWLRDRIRCAGLCPDNRSLADLPCHRGRPFFDGDVDGHCQ